MVKPLIKSHGLELHHAKLGDVELLHGNLSKENLREIRELYEDDPNRLLLDLLDREMSHVVTADGEVIAMCGVDQGGVMWTMFAKSIRKHWRSFVKASPELILFYHNFYPILYCNVWSQNTFIHNWLIHLGFFPDVMLEDHNKNITVHFVRCVEDTISIVSESSRPVMH